MTKKVTDQNFKEEVLEAEKPVVIDFWADWCGPCKILGPIVDKLAEEYEGKVKVRKLNVDNNRKTAGKYGIQGIPTLLFLKNGEVEKKTTGAKPYSQLKKEFDNFLE